MLAIALQLSPYDEMIALDLAELIAQIEPQKRSDVEFAVSARRGTNTFVVDQIVETLKTKFSKVHKILGKRFGDGWPQGCNDLWAETMTRFAIFVRDKRTKATGVMTMEADCIMLRPDWIDVLKAEWERCQKAGKLVVGHEQGEGTVPGIDRHINGNAIFCTDIILKHGALIDGGDGGWDYEHRELLLKVGIDTPFIHQIYRMNPPTRKELLAIRKDGQIPALFHGIKKGAAIGIIRDVFTEGAFK